MTVFRHLFIFPSYREIENFIRGFEERAMYGLGSPNRMGGRHRISLMSHDGQHEITFATVEDIDRRIRGMNFDKVSIHETVEMNWRLHELIQIYVGRSLRGVRIVADPYLRDDQMFFINEDRMKAAQQALADKASEQFWKGCMDVVLPEFKGILSELSI